MRHSVEKARSVANNFDAGLVISADTSVICNGEILGKPQFSEKADEMLTKLSGQRFEVITGLTVLDLSTGKEISESETTIVWMAKISKKQISAYIRTGEPLDKAGAFAAQGKGAIFIERIEGAWGRLLFSGWGKSWKVLAYRSSRKDFPDSHS